MNLNFLGVGEAFDEEEPNTSMVVSKDGYNLLLDCGYSVPNQLWKYNPEENFIDAIYISHLHADHYFGLPALLTRCLEQNREKPFIIISSLEINTGIQDLIEYAYRGVSKYFKFHLEYVNVKARTAVDVGGLNLTFAPTEHTIDNLAIKVTDGNHNFCYSGDGSPLDLAEDLYKNSDLVIHDAYYWDKPSFGHPKAIDLINMAERNSVKNLALVHIERELRKSGELKNKAKSEKVNVFIPEAFSDFVFA